ncbi:MAG: DUF58 domain-containing protein [Planctomycetaceae bacterium]|nr:DUF58 domain-containing protein [Planctomycetaceae bacterium]
MEDSPTSLDPRALASLKGLRLRARQIVEGYMVGLHRSPLRGFSIEFAEHREYAPGDDVRHVDWKVFGRTDKFYVKQYEDETNLICYLVLDVSESMAYQGPGSAMSKLEYARCLVAAFSWLVLQQQDAVALATIGEQVHDRLRPASHPSQWDNVLRMLEGASPAGATRIGSTLHELAERYRKRGIVIILSDLFTEVDELIAGLRHFGHRRHDVVVLEVLDPAELDFPFQRFSSFQGFEQLGNLLADPAAIRTGYLKEMEESRNKVKQEVRKLGMELVSVRTDTPFDVAMREFLEARENRATMG